MLNAATAENLRRKSAYADHVQIHQGKPLFSWLDLNVTDLCNRSAGSPKACVFCPRIDPVIYPNQNLHMPLLLAAKMGMELRGLNYEGVVVLCGFGEPLLHPKIIEVVRRFHGLRVEVVTNGDRLTATFIRELFDAGVSYFLVSMYDGPEQVDRFRTMFAEADCEDYALRDRWHGAEQDYGLKLTNRAGTVAVGNQPEPSGGKCFYPGYELSIDWNGDALLCVQDWTKRLRFGNVHAQSLWSIWTSAALHKRRMMLARGDRSAAPCSGCNAEGTCQVLDHVEAWKAA